MSWPFGMRVGGILSETCFFISHLFQRLLEENKKVVNSSWPQGSYQVDVLKIRASQVNP